MKIYNKILKPIMKFEGLKIVPNNRPKDLFLFLRGSLRYERFDNIAAAAQYYLEKIVTHLCLKINKKYKIRNFYFGGGISMNIKMYKNLANNNFVKKIVNSPSGSDESLSLGACYYLNKNNKRDALTHLNLGRKLVNHNVDLNKIIRKEFKTNKFRILKAQPKFIAKLLHHNKIVAVANGREEFGARALGTRSILANPSNYENVKKINEYIKSRDFWMPFALSIINEKKDKLIINKKKLDSRFMNLSFDTNKKFIDSIKAGCHPYDNTVRPQFVNKSNTPDFYELIIEFYRFSKIPALLNTSLNLHGYPKCSDIYDVIFTFKNSGLKYLFLENKYLIEKFI